jgi:hypothetical protein
MQQKLTNGKRKGGWGSLAHHSSCSSPAKVGSHSIVQPGGRVDGQVTPTTIFSRVPVKIMPQARHTNTQLDLPGVRSLLLYL